MTTSKDMFVEGLPLWQIHENLSQIVKTHGEWQIMPVYTWFHSNPATVSRDAHVKEMSEELARNQFQAGIENLLTTLDVSRKDVIPLAYHVTRTDLDYFVDTVHIFCVKYQNTFASGIDDSTQTTFTSNVDIMCAVGQPIGTLGDTLNNVTETSDSLVFKGLDASFAHNWLHQVAEDNFRNSVFDVQDLIAGLHMFCLTADPAQVSNALHAVLKNRELDAAIKHMATNSNELTREQNLYRRTAAHFLETLHGDELVQAIKVVLE